MKFVGCRIFLLCAVLMGVGSNLSLAEQQMPTFEIMTGKAAEEKIRLLFEGASQENPFVFQGTTPEGKSCSLKMLTPSESEFIVSMELGKKELLTQEEVAKVAISKMATVSRATRPFESYFSEHYKLFIPSGEFDILEYRRRHDGSEYQLVFSSSIHQEKWVACGKFKVSANNSKEIELVRE